MDILGDEFKSIVKFGAIASGATINNVLYRFDLRDIFYIGTTVPILSPNSNIIGETIYFQELPMTMLIDLIAGYMRRNRQNKIFSFSTNDIKVSLSSLQEKIIFLLLAKFTQFEIADVLDYSRSNIGKQIAIMAKKFHLPEPTAECLLAFCAFNNFDQVIPEDFLMSFALNSRSYVTEIC